MRRRRIRTTIIALSLILAMIGGLLPSAMFPAAAVGSTAISDVRSTQIRALQYAGADKSVTYDFWNGIASKEDITLLTDYNPDKNKDWAYYSSYGGSPNGTLVGYYGTLRFQSNQPTNNAWVAFKIQSPDVGKYTATLGYKYHAGAISADMYLLPGDTVDVAQALKSATPIGTITYKQDAAEKNLQTVKIGEIAFPTKGEYLFVMKPNEVNTSTAGAGRSGMSITSLELDGTDPNPVTPPELVYPGTDKSVTYDFWNGITSKEDITALTDYNSAKNKNWAYHSNLGGTTLQGWYGTLRFTASGTAGDAWVAFKLQSPEAGKYTASLTYKYHIGAISADMYLLPGDTADINAALTSATPFGSVTYVQENAATLHSAKLGEVQIPSKGEYLLVLKVKEVSDSSAGASRSGMHITSLTLDGTDPNPVTPPDPPAMEYPGAEKSVLYDFWTGIASKDNIRLLTEYNEDKNKNWKYQEDLYGGAFLGHYGTLRFNCTESSRDAWFAFKIQSPDAGRYMASMSYKYHIGCISADLYMLPGDTQDINTALQTAKPFGGLTFVQDNTATLYTVKLGAVDFPSKGEYIFVMKVRERNPVPSGAGASGMHITTLALDGKEPTPLESVSLNLDNTAVSAKNPAHASVTGLLTTGDQADLRPENLAEISYSSSDTSVVNVDKTGLITAVGSGKATITVSVTLDGVTKTDSKEVVCVTYGGDEATRVIDLMHGLASDGEDVGALTEYHEAKNSDWKYVANYMCEDGFAKTKNGTVSFLGADADAWTAIKFKNKDAGLYQLKLAYRNHVGAKKATAYLLPGDTDAADIESVLKTTDSFRKVFLEPGSDEQIAYFGEISLSENTEYMLVLAAVEGGDNVTAGVGTITAAKIILDGNEPGEEQPVIASAALSYPKELGIGAKAGAKIIGVLVSGDTVDLSTAEGAELSYISSDPETVAVDAVTGIVTALQSGTATISVTVTLGGKSASASATIRVLAKGENLDFPGSKYNTTYDFVSCLARSGENIAGLTEYNPNKNTNWALSSVYNILPTKIISYYGTLRMVSGNAKTWTAFKIKAPHDGKYKASMTYREVPGAAAMDVYVVPGAVDPADIGTAIAGTEPLHSFEYMIGKPTSTLQTEELGEIELSGQTDYYLVLNCHTPTPGAAAGQGTMHITEFILDGTAALESLTAQLIGSATAKSMMPGTSATIKLSTPSNPAEIDQATVTYESLNPEVISVDESGKVTAHKAGTATIQITATLGTVSRTLDLTIVSGSVKTRRGYYTDEKVAAARENIELYPWARSERDKAVQEADKYVGKEEVLWNMVTTQNLPRSNWVGLRNDPEYRLCPYCRVDIYGKYGNGSWIRDPMGETWKIQCPDCRRKFPSNDFESYYNVGIDENGNWQPELSEANGQEFLKNILYPEKGEGWGVDNGFGFVTGKTFDNGVAENKTFIPFYNEMALWYATYNYSTSGTLIAAADSLRDAYLYTGEQKYGRTGAILLDRIADVYPDMDLEASRPYFNADGGTFRGKVLGKISDYNLGLNLGRDYDGLWAGMDDPYVINFLSEKAKQYNMENPKTSAELISLNSDNGILREINKAVRDCRINSNFGHHQLVLATAAVTLDTLPETKEWIDWIFQSGPVAVQKPYNKVEGGNVYAQLVDNVDRDGQGNEAAPAYNTGWINSILLVADVLAGYDKYEAADLYQHPKVQRMMRSLVSFTSCSRYTPGIGDSGTFGAPLLMSNTGNLIKAWNSGIHDPNIARQMYFLCNENVSGLHADIFTKDPEKIQKDIQNVISEDGAAMELGSENMTGYGFMILRDGDWVGGTRGMDTQRDFWMYYGSNGGHGHSDKLNLGLHAYGFDFAPDLGNPEVKTIDPERLQWVEQTMAHNTVTVVEKKGTDINYTNNMQNTSAISTPIHFDDSGMVKVMDADAAEAFDSTDIYRRTVVSVDVDDDVSYAVDFFRVKGGNDHLYSFHAQSHDVTVENAELVPQDGGTYAGPDVPFGADPLTVGEWTTPLKYPAGFTWMYNVSRAEKPAASTISADFKISDYYDVLPQEMNLHLKLTMLNNEELSEFAVVDTNPPHYKGAPDSIKQIVARRTGKNLDSLYTSVIQPYKDQPYIESVEEVSMTVLEGLPGKMDAERAVKVTHTSGRIDYIIYATNKNVTYRVDDSFDFSGFVGVYTVYDGEPIYAYVNDGTKIADVEGLDSYSGTVVDFSNELTINNEITIAGDSAIDAESLAGKYIYIQNDGVQNASYKIENARTGTDGKIILDIGEITLIRKYQNPDDINDGYIYNIAEGQRFTIPLATIMDSKPVFHSIEKKSAEAGSELKFQVVAESPRGKELTYSATSLPRGAQFDPETQTFSWIPDSGLVGKNFAAFEASDGVLSATQYVEITVYNSAGQGGNSSINNPPPGTGGGNTGGGTGTKPGEDDKPPVVKVEEDEVKFAASTGETTANSKLGSVTFTNGTFAEDGQGTLKIKKETEKFNISVSATVDMEKKPAKVSLNYTPADNMTDKNCIVVKDAKGNIIPNGRYADGKMVFYTDTFGDFTIAYNPKSFTDLGNHAWASEAVIRLAARGIINGITRATYGPARNITRADFTTLIVRAFGFEGEVASFADVPANAYYAEPVGIAKTLGIVGGVNETDFAPTAEITRQDMMVIVARALDKAGYMLDASDSPEFSDIEEVSDYAKEAVQTLTASGIIAGAGDKINPKGKTTRAEVAVILDRIVFRVR